MPGAEAQQGPPPAPGGQAGAEAGAEVQPGAEALAPAPAPAPAQEPAPEEAAQEPPPEEAAPAQEPPPALADALAEALEQEQQPEGTTDLSPAEERKLHRDLERSAEADGPQQMLGQEHHLSYASVHAPKGGISIGGHPFIGGQFIPKGVLAKATAQEKAALAGGGRPQQPQQQPAPRQPAATQPAPQPAPQQPAATQPAPQQPAAEQQPAPQQPAAEQPAAEQQQPASPGADILSDQMGGVATEDVHQPVIAAHEWGEMLEVGTRGHGKFAALPLDAQQPVFQSAQRFAVMPLKEFRSEAGRAYERWRNEETRTQQDVYDAAASKMIMAYRGKKSREDYSKKAAKQGVPQAVHNVSKYMQTHGWSYLMNKKKAKSSIQNHIIGSWMQQETLKDVGLDEVSKNNSMEATTKEALQETKDRGMEPSDATAYVLAAARNLEHKQASREHLHNSAINMAKDGLDRFVKAGIAMIPSLIEGFLNRRRPVAAEHHFHVNYPEGGVTHQHDGSVIAYLDDDGALRPVDNAVDNAGAESPPFDPQMEWNRAVRVMASWLKDQLLMTAQTAGGALPRVNWERWAEQESELLAPKMLQIMESKAKQLAIQQGKLAS